MKNTKKETFCITTAKDGPLYCTQQSKRIGGSKLKYDLCFKLHVLEKSSCDCGQEYEDSYHYFMETET